jgi:hypothetical protein
LTVRKFAAVRVAELAYGLGDAGESGMRKLNHLRDIDVQALSDVAGGQTAGECHAAITALNEEQKKLPTAGTGGGQGSCRSLIDRVIAACPAKVIEALRPQGKKLGE